MAACTKVAAFGALLRVFYVGVGGLAWDWEPVIWGVAILTMMVGSVVALTQTDVKRMLAYSSIAHAGFVLVGMVATDAVALGRAARRLVGAVLPARLRLRDDRRVRRRHAGPRRRRARRPTCRSGPGSAERSPVTAAVFAFFLLAFAGIPLTSGFTGEVRRLPARPVEGGACGAGGHRRRDASAIAAFFYVRVIVLMFFSEPAPDGPTVAVPSPLTTITIALSVGVTLLLGVYPSPGPRPGRSGHPVRPLGRAPATCPRQHRQSPAPATDPGLARGAAARPGPGRGGACTTP